MLDVSTVSLCELLCAFVSKLICVTACASVLNKLDKTETTSQLVKRYRSEKWSVWSFDSGLQTLPDELARYLQSANNVEVHTGTSCTELQFTADNVKVVFR